MTLQKKRPTSHPMQPSEFEMTPAIPNHITLFLSIFPKGGENVTKMLVTALLIKAQSLKIPHAF